MRSKTPGGTYFSPEFNGDEADFDVDPQVADHLGVQCGEDLRVITECWNGGAIDPGGDNTAEFLTLACKPPPGEVGGDGGDGTVPGPDVPDGGQGGGDNPDLDIPDVDIPDVDLPEIYCPFWGRQFAEAFQALLAVILNP